VVGSTQSSPTRTRFPASSIGSVQAGIGIPGSSHDGDSNPVQPTASTTPSWVLPKKTPPATVAGGSVGGSGGGGGLFGGISLSDPAVGSGSPPNQGVGTLA